jgi:hypothetical protein
MHQQQTTTNTVELSVGCAAAVAFVASMMADLWGLCQLQLDSKLLSFIQTRA